jgi:hypothetical protein
MLSSQFIPGAANSGGQGFRLHHHARTATIGPVIGYLVAIRRKGADIHGPGSDAPAFDCPFDDAIGPEAVEQLGKKGQDANLHAISLSAQVEANAYAPQRILIAASFRLRCPNTFVVTGNPPGT